MVHSTDKQLEEHGDKVEASVKAEIESARADLKAAIEADDPADIKTKSEALQAAAAMKMGEAIYSAQQAEAAEADGQCRRRQG